MLQAWAGPRGVIAASAAKVPRGRSGPGHNTSEGLAPVPDMANLLLTTVVPMVTMMAQQTMSSLKRSSHRRRSSPSSLPPSSPPRNSSPPPAVEDELEVFLKAFGQSKGISAKMIEQAGDGLRAAHYMPDAISEITLSVDRLRELTQLPEGVVYSLCHFARIWCGKVDAKRPKLKHH